METTEQASSGSGIVRQVALSQYCLDDGHLDISSEMEPEVPTSSPIQLRRVLLGFLWFLVVHHLLRLVRLDDHLA